MSAATTSFRAMGTDCRVSVWSEHAERLAALAIERVEILEQSWSRFRSNSELTRLNSRAGRGAVEVSADLAMLVRTMREAWSWTGGLFDPTVIESMRALGYDADFATVIARDAVAAVEVHAAPGMSGVSVDGSSVTLPVGIGLDPGAIGKGLAGDIVVDELMSAGARGVLIDLGGDIVLAGSPDDDTWTIAIADDRADGADLAVMQWQAPIDRLALATSSTLKRRWAHGRHHVIDPRTGDVASLDVAQATVIAAAGWRAEVAATAAMLLGAERGSAWLESEGLQGWLLTDEMAGVRHG